MDKILCIICLNELGSDLYLHPCSHRYHKTCWKQQFEKGNGSCSICHQWGGQANGGEPIQIEIDGKKERVTSYLHLI